MCSQQAIFKADGEIKRTNSPMKGISHKNPVAAGDSLHWEDQFSSIPPIPPSHLGGGCKTIDVKYLVTVGILFCRRDSLIAMQW